MYVYLITVLCLREADDYTDHITTEAEAIKHFDALTDEAPKDVVQVMMTTINTDVVNSATVNRNWRRP